MRAHRILSTAVAVGALGCASLASPAMAASSGGLHPGSCGGARSSIGFEYETDLGHDWVCWEGHGDQVDTDIDIVHFLAGPESSGYFWYAGQGSDACVNQKHFTSLQTEDFVVPINLCSIHLN
ncbi:hypothetical protein ACIA58_00950 [Kribbella sp. NPDC051586]|uniref:hypothetical protein n=1 Tax=Kribbella sp. NPDC051586 TaxID=3364118 RepID=UPI0037A3BA08